ncbi:hypothetical protein SK128_027950 [Halocaridina rubra]|uniref:Uncharacterized protein n=1 Tax=Halocaridina rubra TaxID=373956 RepID=A0AAN8XMW0_HALRR
MRSYILLLTLLAVGVRAKPGFRQKNYSKAIAFYCRVFSGPNSSGNYLDVSDYIPDLSLTGIDNDIESVSQTGLWLYYENVDFNAIAGRMYFVHGIEIDVNFPSEYSNIVSSIRYVGDASNPNSDSWTLYEGQYFTGDEYFGVADSASLAYLDNEASSLVLTGLSPWTFYSGQSWTGSSLCVYPDTDHDVGPQGDFLDFGIYPDITTTGIPDNAIRSVRKGCWGRIAKPPPMKVEGRAKNGAWGYVDM